MLILNAPQARLLLGLAPGEDLPSDEVLEREHQIILTRPIPRDLPLSPFLP